MPKIYSFFYKKEDTEIIVSLNNKKYIKIIKKKINEYHSIIKSYIKNDPYFLITTKPYIIKKKTPRIIKKMIIASMKTNTGPMSCVAGAIAYETVKYLKRIGCNFIIINNGGDIAIYNPIKNNNLTLKIYTGTNYFKNIKINITKNRKIFGICTSSSSIGRSISFGDADSVTVFSKDVILADAAATSICNSLKGNSKEDINRSLMNIRFIKGISSIIIIKNKKIGFIGKKISFSI